MIHTMLGRDGMNYNGQWRLQLDNDLSMEDIYGRGETESIDIKKLAMSEKQAGTN
ncbi:hypothetical protein M2678_000465 [Staphylococcus pseudintermedius]|nr:hypothetical protein [Staphylococcus pseudintermedius]